MLYNHVHSYKSKIKIYVVRYLRCQAGTDFGQIELIFHLNMRTVIHQITTRLLSNCNYK